MGISIIKKRWSRDRLIFILGIPVWLMHFVSDHKYNLYCNKKLMETEMKHSWYLSSLGIMVCFIEHKQYHSKCIIVINNVITSTHVNAYYMSMCIQLIYANEGTTWVCKSHDVICHELISWFMKFKHNCILWQ